MPVQISYPLTMQPAFAGMKADSGEDDVRTFVNAEATAEMPFGVAVAQGTTEPRAILPAAGTAKLVGVVLHSHDYDPFYDLGTVGVKPKLQVSVMNRGRVWVVVEEAVAVNDRAFVRFAAGAGGTQLGAFRRSADTATALEARGWRYISAAGAGGLAKVELDVPAWFSHQ